MNIIKYFFVILAFHLGLFSLSFYHQSFPENKTQVSQSLSAPNSLKIVSFHQKMKADHSPKKNLKKTPSHKTLSTKTHSSLKKFSPPKMEVPSSSVINKAAKTQNVKSWLSELKMELRTLIDQNKSYPRLSRRLGQRGTVVVAFTLLKDGNIINVRIVGPSEFHRLNDSALRAVKSIEKFRPLPSDLDEEKIDFEVPIRFLTI